MGLTEKEIFVSVGNIDPLCKSRGTAHAQCRNSVE